MNKVFEKLNFKIIKTDSTKIKLICSLSNVSKSTKVSFLAPNCPDYNDSYTGSALPFSDPEIAFENTPNKGSIFPKNNEFSINLNMPNSYYTHLGSRIVLPHVFIKVFENDNLIISENIILGEVAPFRLLSYPSNPKPRSDPLFYKQTIKYPRSQETILRDSAYIKNTPENFWGKTVPHA